MYRRVQGQKTWCYNFDSRHSFIKSVKIMLNTRVYEETTDEFYEFTERFFYYVRQKIYDMGAEAVPAAHVAKPDRYTG